MWSKGLCVFLIVAALGSLTMLGFTFTPKSQEDSIALAVEYAVMEYVAERHPGAPLQPYLRFAHALLIEANRLSWDHCLLLAQSEIESDFRSDVRGRAGEIGIFQILPSTAALFQRNSTTPCATRRSRDSTYATLPCGRKTFVRFSRSTTADHEHAVRSTIGS